MEGREYRPDLDAVNGVDVLHAVDDNSPDLLQGLVRTHDTDGVALNKDVTLGQQLNRLS
jgi:hypothetical protein